MGEVTRFRGPTGHMHRLSLFFFTLALTPSQIRNHPTWHRATRPAANDASLPSAQSASPISLRRRHRPTAPTLRASASAAVPAACRPRPLPEPQQSCSPSPRRLNAAIADLAVVDLALCSSSLHRGRRRRTEPAAGSPSPRRPGTKNRSGAPSGLADRRPLRRPLRPPPLRRWIECSLRPRGSQIGPSALASPDRDN
ncbi:hypothetical protein Taro_005995 [Colocasia esculenta]|uniref:Uncharacterized protein n=1 Tax=Colocasia esculenta TaxID=4460 RepID=A0A843TW69_COLES|nr:hypothetical protein [Colocasia esculenta]